jgi:hypothetical protein
MVRGKSAIKNKHNYEIKHLGRFREENAIFSKPRVSHWRYHD